jgi:hypothetical protein
MGLEGSKHPLSVQCPWQRTVTSLVYYNIYSSNQQSYSHRIVLLNTDRVKLFLQHKISLHLYYKGRNIWEQFSPNVKHTHPSQRTHMSGEAHPKELDETWDSQIFRFSKMFPLKTKFFCYQAQLFTHPCVPAPWFVASSRVYTFLVCTFLQM